LPRQTEESYGIFITATYDTIRGTTHHPRTCGHIPKTELKDRGTAVASAILEAPENN
jgi:hypothetical protein